MPYVAWKPDPSAWAIDAFTLNWSDYSLSYCFPPFSLIGMVLQKFQLDRARVILIVPHWTTQFWYPMLLKIMDAPPYHTTILIGCLYPGNVNRDNLRDNNTQLILHTGWSFANVTMSAVPNL